MISDKPMLICCFIDTHTYIYILCINYIIYIILLLRLLLLLLLYIYIFNIYIYNMLIPCPSLYADADRQVQPFGPSRRRKLDPLDDDGRCFDDL